MKSYSGSNQLIIVFIVVSPSCPANTLQEDINRTWCPGSAPLKKRSPRREEELE